MADKHLSTFPLARDTNGDEIIPDDNRLSRDTNGDEILPEAFLGPYVEWRGFLAHPDNLPEARPGVYGFCCRVNGKWYIGISNKMTDRLSHHGRDNEKFARAIKKYGRGEFIVYPLLYSINGTDYLPEVEADLIVDYSALSKTGYNVVAAWGGVGPYGPEHGATIRAAFDRPGVREARSKAITVALNRPEVKAQKSASARIAQARPEIRAKNSEGVRAARASPQVRAQMSAAAHAALARPEVKAKLSAAATKANADPELRARHKANTTARWADPEHRAKMTVKIIEAVNRPEVKAHVRAANREINSRPEVRAKHRANSTAMWARRKAAPPKERG